MYVRDQVIILPDKIISYPVFDCHGSHTRFNINEYSKSFENISDDYKTDKQDQQGKKDISNNTFRKLKYACNTLLFLSDEKTNMNFKLGKMFKWRLNFITLTLPAPQNDISDSTLLNNCLTPFLQHIRRKNDVHHYVWKAEPQDNGNLHFHIATDKYIYYENVCRIWNSLLYPTGLIDDYRSKHHNSNPNSTDIHSIKNPGEIYAYFAKYFSKKYKTPRREVKCRKWGCSHSLTYDKKFAFTNSDVQNNFFKWVDNYIEDLRKDFDYFTVYNVALSKYIDDLPYDVKESLLSWKARLNAL